VFKEGLSKRIGLQNQGGLPRKALFGQKVSTSKLLSWELGGNYYSWAIGFQALMKDGGLLLFLTGV